MSDIQRAASNVQHLAKQYAAVIELGKVLEKMGSVENLNAEIAAQTDKLRVKEAEALAAKDAAEHAHKQVMAEHEAKITAMQGRALAFKERAVVEVKEIVDRAEAEAKNIRENAHDAATDALRAKDEAERALHELEGEVAERSAELAKLKGEIDALRERAKAFAG